MQTFFCFNLVIHGYDLNRIIEEVLTRISLNKTTWIVTANPEILLYAHKHPDYSEVIRQADLRTVDGTGLQFAGYWRGAKPKRVSGVILAESLIELSVKKSWTIVLIGGMEGVADKAAWFLRKKFPNIKVFSEPGGTISINGISDEEGEHAIVRIQEYEPDIIFVAFGHPKQEQWIYRNRDKFPTVKVYIGVGGTFDYWAEKVKRAPIWIQKTGFEWLHRLIVEPKRFKRIWNALVVFPWTFFINK